ncbi:choline/ethanolamine kinase family protein [Sulfurovum sp.]|uniref:choline/ethanolamine kinase family protein n=1 Tax=Sulfurovum sp. TaxID=1969726 RepID=UPI0035680427
MIDQLKKHPFFKEKHITSWEPVEIQSFCNENYLVIADQKKYIVRKFLRTDIDRDFEYKVHTLAFDAGITSELLLFDLDKGMMISSFLEGVHKDTLSENDFILLADTLRKVHSFHIQAEPVKIKIQNKSADLKQALEIITQHDKELVLCHNDLNPKNILFSNDVKFIDWEYAGVNDKYFDLACVCVEFELSPLKEQYFLESYFQSKKSNEDKLRAYKILYTELYKEWFLNNKTQ